MSLKENIGLVKEELNSEEKFFETAVVTERFVKKYKNLLIGGAIGIAFVISANIAYDLNEANRIEEANRAFLALKASPNDAIEIEKLKNSSSELYDLWRYSRAIAAKDTKTLTELQSSKAMLVADLASYEASAGDAKKIQEYAAKEGAIYKELAAIESAIVLLDEKRVDEAHKLLAAISEESPMKKVAQALMHYGVK
ncbi:MAG: hypothetical protein IE916_05905 [Epsilonproteobacteria bacterium]|nr:hypothetical protein [Campylobacterota bacterium]